MSPDRESVLHGGRDCRSLAKLLALRPFSLAGSPRPSRSHGSHASSGRARLPAGACNMQVHAKNCRRAIGSTWPAAQPHCRLHTTSLDPAVDQPNFFQEMKNMTRTKGPSSGMRNKKQHRSHDILDSGPIPLCPCQTCTRHNPVQERRSFSNRASLRGRQY